MRKFFLLGLITLVAISVFAQDTTVTFKLFLGTGEYSPKDDWHGILRLESIPELGSNPDTVSITSAPTIPIKQCIDNGVKLNFGHGFYYNETDDDLYIVSIFTNKGNFETTSTDTAVGSIAIIPQVSTKSGPQVDSFRHIFGDSTQILQPHSCWVDESRDMLYVANTFGENILVFNNASTVAGNVVPNRVISSTKMGRPVYVFIDEQADRMFVACMKGGTGEGDSQVIIYNSASALDGVNDPDVRIFGDSTKLSNINGTVHNVWFKGDGELLAVGHHTYELSIFDLSTINLDPASPEDHNIPARIINVNVDPNHSDSTDTNLYGFYWDTKDDVIYCSVGVDNPGGGPKQQAPPNSIKVYKNVSNSSVKGQITPDRVIYWDNGDIYYPPQPVWVIKEQTISGIEDRTHALEFFVYPNPSKGDINIEFEAPSGQEISLDLFNTDGKLILNRKIQVVDGLISRHIDLPEGLNAGVYILNLKTTDSTITRKIIIQ
ncbi:MAG: hypothetical protein COC01_00775 [Bacteroidetes bacterium]|nr:MAG: hypothetical protein COC01_00775 [Bacteroidota bacterium]